jgi:2-methylcitrate dehydratase PrpD
MNESLTLAKHIVATNYDDIPANVADITKRSFFDGLATILAGGGLGEGCKQFVNMAIAGGGREESTIISFDAKVPACMAAFANGSMAHAIDFEDTHDLAHVHPNAATIPAALAVAEAVGNVSGKEFVTALALGSDIVCRLGLALQEDPLKYGWYMPPILGAFGAATAAAKLLKISQEKIVDAFSLTLCQATCSAELTHSTRSIVRAIRDAFSAKAGVLSAQLAQRGITGFEQPIEGKAGLFRLYARRDYDLSVLTNGLGKIFEGANVSFKPWPSCRGTHSFVEATLQILETHDFNADDIEAIKLTISSTPIDRMLCDPLERKQSPTTAIDAKFSIPFAVAVAAVHRELTLDHFMPGGLRDPGVLEVAKKVSCEVDSKLEANQGFIEIRVGHKVISLRIPEFAYGHPTKPMSWEALVAKFIDCASHSAKQIPRGDLSKLIDLILHLEDVNSMEEVVLSIHEVAPNQQSGYDSK